MSTFYTAGFADNTPEQIVRSINAATSHLFGIPVIVTTPEMADYLATGQFTEEEAERLGERAIFKITVEKMP